MLRGVPGREPRIGFIFDKAACLPGPGPHLLSTTQYLRTMRPGRIDSCHAVGTRPQARSKR